MNTRRKVTISLLLVMMVLLSAACNDWDGLHRGEWKAQYGPPTRQPLPTPQGTPPGVREGDDKLWMVIWGEALTEAK